MFGNQIGSQVAQRPPVRRHPGKGGLPCAVRPSNDHEPGLRGHNDPFSTGMLTAEVRRAAAPAKATSPPRFPPSWGMRGGGVPHTMRRSLADRGVGSTSEIRAAPQREAGRTESKLQTWLETAKKSAGWLVVLGIVEIVAGILAIGRDPGGLQPPVRRFHDDHPGRHRPQGCRRRRGRGLSPAQLAARRGGCRSIRSERRSFFLLASPGNRALRGVMRENPTPSR